MKRLLWRLARRTFHSEFLRDVDAALFPLYRARVIDSGLLHLLDARLKYGHQGLWPGEEHAERMPPPWPLCEEHGLAVGACVPCHREGRE